MRKKCLLQISLLTFTAVYFPYVALDTSAAAARTQAAFPPVGPYICSC